MKNFLKKIGLFFTGLFNAAARTWAKVSPEVQEALKQGSGLLAVAVYFGFFHKFKH